MSSNGSMMNKGKHKRPAPLKIAKEELRQIRRPVISHIYSPQIIHVDVAQFSSLVQSLTGRKPQQQVSPRALDSKAQEYRFASPRNRKLASFEHLHRPVGPFEVSRPKPDAVSNKAGTMLSNAVRATAGGPRYSPGYSAAVPSPPLHLFSSLPSTSLTLSPKP